MKKGLIAFVVLFSFNSVAFADSIGAFFSTTSWGVQYKQGDMRYSLGLDDLSIIVDKSWNLGAVAQDQDLNLGYLFLGGQFVDANNKIGIRGGIGIQIPVQKFVIFGEFGPTIYVYEDFDADLEFSIGARYKLQQSLVK